MVISGSSLCWLAVAVRLSVARPGDTNCCSKADTTCGKLGACGKGVVAGLILHPLTFYFLLIGDEDALSFKSVEVMFESVPQFILQTYSIFLFGFGFTATGTTLGLPSNVLGPVMKKIGVFTSFVSTVHGVNADIVNDNFSSLTQRNILKCFLYTLPGLLIRLLLSPLSCLLAPVGWIRAHYKCRPHYNLGHHLQLGGPGV